MFFDPEFEEAIKARMNGGRDKPADARAQRLNNLIAEFLACGASEDEAKTVAREIVDKGRIAPCEAQYRQAPIAYAYEDCKVPEETRQPSYDEKALTRYFINAGSYLAPHEHLKYLECERQENEQ